MLVGPFVLTERVGEGAMGEVWRAHHATDRQAVAVKVITSRRARNPAARRAFAREVQAMARLHHPHVLMLLDAGEVSPDAAIASQDRLIAQSPYLVMELASGTLVQHVDRIADFDGLKRLLLELLDALAHAHARGVVHRDIKPLNVLLVEEGEGARFKLADFGVAHAFRHSEAEPDGRAGASGTPRYMAPEQAVGAIRDQGPWTDLYSLGCLAYWIAAGSTPFTGSLAQVIRAHLEADVPALASRFAVAEGFEDWLRQLMAKRPKDRFRYAADAAHQLMQLEPPPAQAPAPDPLPPSRPAEDQTTYVFALADWETRQDRGPRMARAARAPMSKTWRELELEPVRHLRGAGLGLYALRPVPLVGRQLERDELWGRLQAVHREGRARAVVVRGPSGVGKSRLVEWFAERAQELGAAEMIEANHGPIPGPNDGLVASIRRHSQTGGLERDDRLERIYLQLTDDGRQKEIDGMAWRLLADLCGPEPVAARAEDRHHAQARYLSAISRDRPVIVWIDDAQWGPDALQLCHHTIGQQARVLFVLTVREDALVDRPLEAERLGAIIARDGTSVIDLGPLGRDEHESLVRRLVGLSSDLAQQVIDRTMGNALFAVQLVGDWVERGVLEVGEEGFHLAPGESAPLPDGLHAVWSDRVDRVVGGLDDPTAGRWALEIAAALGHVLDEDEWRAVCRRRGLEPPRRLGRAMQRARLAWPRHGHHEDGWAFAHAMLRESLLRDAAESGRLSEHHRACARELLTRGGAGEHHERIAEHWIEAGEIAAALQPLFESAEFHSRRGDFDRALAIDDRRDALVERLGLPPSDPLRIIGGCRRVRTMCIRGDYESAKSRIDGLVEAAKGADAATLAELRWTQGVYARHDNDPVAGQRWIGEALRHFEALGDAGGAARCHKKLGEMLRIAGSLDEAAEHYETALEQFDELDDPFEVAWSAMGLCATERQRGDLDAAARRARQSLATFERMGGQLGVGHAHNELGEIARYRGVFDKAVEHYLRVLEVWGRQPHRDLDLVRYNLAQARLGAGELDEARDMLLELRGVAEPLPHQGLLLYVTASLCEVAALQGDWEGCHRRLETVRPMFDRLPLVDIDLASSMRRAGERALTAKRMDLGTDLLRLAIAQLEALGDAAGAEALRERIP